VKSYNRENSGVILIKMGIEFSSSKSMDDMAILGGFLLTGGIHCFKAYNWGRELQDAKKEVAELKKDLIRKTYSNRIYREGALAAQERALISVRRENNILKQEVAMLTSGGNIVEFTVPSNMGPGMVATIQSPHGLRRQIVLPEGANPGSVHKVDFAVKKEESSFTKEELEDIMNGIFSVSEEIDNGRYLSLNNKLKMIHDGL